MNRNNSDDIREKIKGSIKDKNTQGTFHLKTKNKKKEIINLEDSDEIITDEADSLEIDEETLLEIERDFCRSPRNDESTEKNINNTEISVKKNINENYDNSNNILDGINLRGHRKKMKIESTFDSMTVEEESFEKITERDLKNKNKMIVCKNTNTKQSFIGSSSHMLNNHVVNQKKILISSCYENSIFSQEDNQKNIYTDNNNRNDGTVLLDSSIKKLDEYASRAPSRTLGYTTTITPEPTKRRKGKFYNAEYFDTEGLICKTNNMELIKQASEEIPLILDMIEQLSKLSLNEFKNEFYGGRLNFKKPKTKLKIITIGLDPGSTHCGIAFLNNITNQIIAIDGRDFRGPITDDLTNNELVANVMNYFSFFQMDCVQIGLENQKTVLFQDWDKISSNNRVDRKAFFEAHTVQTIIQTMFTGSCIVLDPNQVKKFFGIALLSKSFSFKQDMSRTQVIQRNKNKEEAVKEIEKYMSAKIFQTMQRKFPHTKKDISDGGLLAIYLNLTQNGIQTPTSRPIVDF